MVLLYSRPLRRFCSPSLKRQPGVWVTALALRLRPRPSSGALSPRVAREGEGGALAVVVVRSGMRWLPLPFQLTGGAFLCNGVQSSRTELSENLSSKSIMLSCLKESKLSSVIPYTDFLTNLPSDVTAQTDVVLGAF